ncbi:MAG: SAM-dependent methyltransferase, partial [Alphaproteobacteria bacterium]|nr:SAM-dependent methyltransferase [Alphaproteobacteria bacterium]
MEIFNRDMLGLHLRRAQKNWSAARGFLNGYLAAQIQDRLLDIKRDFSATVEIASVPAVLTQEFLQQKTMQPHFQVAPVQNITATPQAVIDEEFWPFARQSLDAIISVGHLHWVNDVPGALVQCRQSLQPDGLFIAAFFGGETLGELRASIAAVEMEIYGGISPRVSPFAGLQDMAALMQRAQFALPVVDSEMVTVTYANFWDLVTDLRATGQSNAVIKRDRRILKREFWPCVAAYYQEHFANNQGRLNVTVEIIHALGWAPAQSQPKPLARG